LCRDGGSRGSGGPAPPASAAAPAPRGRAVERLDLRLLVHAERHRSLGRIEIELSILMQISAIHRTATATTQLAQPKTLRDATMVSDSCGHSGAADLAWRKDGGTRGGQTTANELTATSRIRRSLRRSASGAIAGRSRRTTSSSIRSATRRPARRVRGRWRLASALDGPQAS
jgi:hypothetical protein